MAEQKYLLFPGYVRSKVDGDEHFIGAVQLAQLHGVDLRECVVVPWGQEESVLAGRDCSKLKVLRPSYHGTYRDEQHTKKD